MVILLLQVPLLKVKVRGSPVLITAVLALHALRGRVKSPRSYFSLRCRIGGEAPGRPERKAAAVTLRACGERVMLTKASSLQQERTTVMSIEGEGRAQVGLINMRDKTRGSKQWETHREACLEHTPQRDP